MGRGCQMQSFDSERVETEGGLPDLGLYSPSAVRRFGHRSQSRFNTKTRRHRDTKRSCVFFCFFVSLYLCVESAPRPVTEKVNAAKVGNTAKNITNCKPKSCIILRK